MQTTHPLRPFERATFDYTQAVLDGNTDHLAEAAWRLYELHGCPLGDYGRAMVVWLKYKTGCTQN